jgi:hypothetical protein
MQKQKVEISRAHSKRRSNGKSGKKGRQENGGKKMRALLSWKSVALDAARWFFANGSKHVHAAVGTDWHISVHSTANEGPQVGGRWGVVGAFSGFQRPLLSDRVNQTEIVDARVHFRGGEASAVG